MHSNIVTNKITKKDHIPLGCDMNWSSQTLSSSGTDGSLNSTVDPSEGDKPLLDVGLIEQIPRVVMHNVYAKPEDHMLLSCD